MQQNSLTTKFFSTAFCVLTVAFIGLTACANHEQQTVNTHPKSEFPTAHDWASVEPYCVSEDTCTNLGIHYLLGDQVPQNNDNAFRLFTQGCNLNNGTACHYLGYMYHEGVGTTKDIKQAIPLLKKSCNLSGDACVELANIYIIGEDAPTNKELGKSFLKQGCDKNFAEACYNLATMYYNQSHDVKVRAQARTFYTKACNLKNGLSCTILAYMYQSGQGGAKNTSKAREYFGKGCGYGDVDACAIIRKGKF